MKTLRGLFLLAWLSTSALAQEARTPLAGEPWTGDVLGHFVDVPPRDRSRTSFLTGVFAPTLGGPEETTSGLGGGAVFWRATPADRMRAIVAGIANDVRLSYANDETPAPFVTLENVMLPWARAEIAEGKLLRSSELERNVVRVGIGLATFRPLSPRAADSGLEIAASLEGGGAWFARGGRTDPLFVLPVSMPEARLHVRARADALARNLLELPHRGWAMGLDAVAARRSRAESWGMPGSLEPARRGYAFISAFCVRAFGAPGLSERHAVVVSAYAGAGAGMDRFSAFRLGAGTTWGDVDTLATPVVPGAAVDELLASRYALVRAEYRYEVAPVTDLQILGTLAYTAGAPGNGTPAPSDSGAYPSIGAGVTSGLPWGLSIELAYAYGFGLERERGGRVSRRGSGLLVTLSKGI